MKDNHHKRLGFPFSFMRGDKISRPRLKREANEEMLAAAVSYANDDEVEAERQEKWAENELDELSERWKNYG